MADLYEPFVIRIKPKPVDGAESADAQHPPAAYEVEAESQGGVWESSFANNLTELQQRSLNTATVWLAEGRLDELKYQQIGATLFNLIFTGAVRDGFQKAYLRAFSLGRRLRVVLILPLALRHWPWELLYDDQIVHGYLARSNTISIVRHIEVNTLPNLAPLSLPLQLLVIISSPTSPPEMAPLSVAVEAAEIARIFDGGGLTTLRLNWSESWVALIRFVGAWLQDLLSLLFSLFRQSPEKEASRSLASNQQEGLSSATPGADQKAQGEASNTPALIDPTLLEKERLTWFSSGTRAKREEFGTRLRRLMTRPAVAVTIRPAPGSNERATEQNVARWLQEKQWHIIHFAGHGSAEADGSYLILEDENGVATPIRGDKFASLFEENQSVNLVVLNACETAKESEKLDTNIGQSLTFFQGVAQALRHHGVPAVLGMHVKILDRMAIHFAREFYVSWAEQRPLEECLAAARRFMEKPGSIAGLWKSKGDWSIPILYLVPDGLTLPPLAMSDDPLTDPSSRQKWWARALTVPNLLLALIGTFMLLWGVWQSQSEIRDSLPILRCFAAPAMQGNFNIAVFDFVEFTGPYTDTTKTNIPFPNQFGFRSKEGDSAQVIVDIANDVINRNFWASEMGIQVKRYSCIQNGPIQELEGQLKEFAEKKNVNLLIYGTKEIQEQEPDTWRLYVLDQTSTLADSPELLQLWSATLAKDPAETPWVLADNMRLFTLLVAGFVRIRVTDDPATALALWTQMTKGLLLPGAGEGSDLLLLYRAIANVSIAEERARYLQNECDEICEQALIAAQKNYQMAFEENPCLLRAQHGIAVVGLYQAIFGDEFGFFKRLNDAEGMLKELDLEGQFQMCNKIEPDNTILRTEHDVLQLKQSYMLALINNQRTYDDRYQPSSLDSLPQCAKKDSGHFDPWRSDCRDVALTLFSEIITNHSEETDVETRSIVAQSNLKVGNIHFCAGLIHEEKSRNPGETASLITGWIDQKQCRKAEARALREENPAASGKDVDIQHESAKAQYEYAIALCHYQAANDVNLHKTIYEQARISLTEVSSLTAKVPNDDEELEEENLAECLKAVHLATSP